MRYGVYSEIFGAEEVFSIRNGYPSGRFDRETSLESIEKSLNQSGINSAFPEISDRDLAWTNLCAKNFLLQNQSMEAPASVIMEIPFS